MKAVLDYIENNSTLLFKCSSKNSNNAIFDSKGFWLSEEAQIVYDKIKKQPHLYVAWTLQDSGYYYVGKSFQNGGRWKREHAYHLGTLAYHLLDNIRKDDQNHLHWIDAWMIRNTMKKIDKNNYSISLNEAVYICFIPFEIYSELNNEDLSIQKIRAINHEYEEKLIHYYRRNGISLLNVQNNHNRKKQKTSNTSKKELISKNVSTNNDNLSPKNCVSFKVNQNELIHNVAQTKDNLLVGPCYLTIKDEDNQKNFVYIKANGDFVRKISTKGKTVSEYFKAPDTNYGNKKTSKSRVVQIEMIKRKIKTIDVTVCQANASRPLIDPQPEGMNNKKPPTIIKPRENSKASLIGDSESCKIVFICASKKKPNSDLKIGGNIIKFRAISNPAANEYKPDDLISQGYINTLKKLNGIELANGSTWRDLIQKNNKKGNPLKLCKAYELYKGEIYRNLKSTFGGHFYILSAGWGLVRSDIPLPNYNITFTNDNKIPTNTIREDQAIYKDFNQLDNDSRTIIFIGTPGYLKIFYQLTRKMSAQKIVFWKNHIILNTPLPNTTFNLIKYKTKNNSSWWKELAKNIIQENHKNYIF